MNSQYRRAGPFNLLSQIKSRLFSLKTAYLASDGDFQVVLKRTDHLDNLVGIIEQVRPVLAFIGTRLGTTKIYIYRIAVILKVPRCLEQVLGIVCRELHY